MEGPACTLPHGHSPPSFISWFSKLSKLACRASEDSIFGFSHPATGLYLLSQQQSRSRANCWPAHRIYTCKDDQSLSPRRATEAEQASQGNVTRGPHSALAWAPWQQSTPSRADGTADCPVTWRLLWQTDYLPELACSAQLARSHTGNYLHESKSTQRQQMAKSG